MSAATTSPNLGTGGRWSQQAQQQLRLKHLSLHHRYTTLHCPVAAAVSVFVVAAAVAAVDAAVVAVVGAGVGAGVVVVVVVVVVC